MQAGAADVNGGNARWETAAANPVLVEMRRGGNVESAHRGAVSVMSADGAVIASLGDVERPVFPRSAVKMIQALPLIESGAADRFRLGHREVALACASHSGEAVHVHAVERWLADVGLSTDALECGAQTPFDRAAADALIAAHRAPGAAHNNCSGKHAGFLTTARHCGDDPRGYIEPAHPVQRRVTDALCEMTGIDLHHAPCGVDGCGIPTYAIPLRAVAKAMARLATPASSGVRADASRRIVEAMTAEPLLGSGSSRFDYRAMTIGAGRFAVKMGAEGVHVAIVPGLGLGIALKIDDGASRAAEVAMATLLHRLGLIEGAEADVLRVVPVLNNRQDRVGEITASSEIRAVAALCCSAKSDIKHET